jgi:hypothetical protein
MGLSGSPVTFTSFPSATVASTPQWAEQMRQMPGRVVVCDTAVNVPRADLLNRC